MERRVDGDNVKGGKKKRLAVEANDTIDDDSLWKKEA